MTQVKGPLRYHGDGRIASDGRWLPTSRSQINQWINLCLDKARRRQTPRSRAVHLFEEFIEKTPEVYMLFNQMLVEVPYQEDPTNQPQITTVKDLLLALDQILISPPGFSDPTTGNMLSAPINNILNWPMGTKAGFAAFIRSDVNDHFSRILNTWAKFLETPESCATLTSQCWFSSQALATPGMRNFEQTYICDPTAPHMGFRSWDDFFTRRFKPGLRTLPFLATEAGLPENENMMVNACESTTFTIQHSVALRDRFWLKGQPYSLAHMLDSEDLGRIFEGGTVYQAYLSADSYHRWHAPVSGYALEARIVKGAYYSEPLCYGFSPDEDDDGRPDHGADPAACCGSEGYITCVNTRQIFLIESSAPAIGLVAMIMVGMGDISSTESTIGSGREVQRGDEMGMFHYGGSTWCLLLQKGVDIHFVEEGKALRKVNSLLASARLKERVVQKCPPW